MVVMIAALSGIAEAERPYVQPVLPAGSTSGNFVVRINRATEWDIYFSSGYEQARILGRRILFEGSVTNISDHPYEGVRITFTARDIFGNALAKCASKVTPAELPGGKTGSFRCAVDVPIAEYLNRITYSVNVQPP